MLPWPPNALYAVAPKARMYLHPISRRYSSSACKYGRHRLISPCFGVRLSGGRHLTTLVTCADSRVSPCRASSSHRSCPLGPTNGSPWRSSSAPGASPTTAKAGLSLGVSGAMQTVTAVSCRAQSVQAQALGTAFLSLLPFLRRNQLRGALFADVEVPVASDQKPFGHPLEQLGALPPLTDRTPTPGS